MTCVMVIFCFHGMFGFVAMIRKGKPPWRLRSLRLSIWQVMVLTVAVAGYLALLRAMIVTFPDQEDAFVVILALSALPLYVTFCVLFYMIYVSVRNIRAVLRGDRIRYEDRYSIRLKNPGKEGGPGCRDDPGSR